MKCRSCGFEIADKAIVCYRCGTPTADPAPRPAARPARSRWVAPAIAVVLALLAMWFVPRTAHGSLERVAIWCTAAGLAVVAVLLVLWRARRR